MRAELKRLVQRTGNTRKETKVKIEVALRGTNPILLSTQRGADPTNELVQQLALVTRIPGPKKTSENHAEIKRIQFLLNLPYDQEQGVVLPTVNVWNAIRDIARGDKMGKNVERYMAPLLEQVPLIYDGPRDLDSLVKEAAFYDTRLVNHGTGGKTAMVIHTRPMFKPWAAVMTFRIEEEKIDPKDFQKWVRSVGENCGVGAYRKFYGRFEPEFKVLQ
jgi:hypothetical protein